MINNKLYKCNNHQALPIICFAFNCHLSYIPIFSELKRPVRHVLSMDKVAVGTPPAFADGALFVFCFFPSASPTARPCRHRRRHARGRRNASASPAACTAFMCRDVPIAPYT